MTPDAIPWGELVFCIPICAVSCWLIERVVGAVTGRLKRIMCREKCPTECPTCGSRLINPMGLMHPCAYCPEISFSRDGPHRGVSTHVIIRKSGHRVYVCDEHLGEAMGILRAEAPLTVESF